MMLYKEVYRIKSYHKIVSKDKLQKFKTNNICQKKHFTTYTIDFYVEQDFSKIDKERVKF